MHACQETHEIIGHAHKNSQKHLQHQGCLVPTYPIKITVLSNYQPHYHNIHTQILHANTKHTALSAAPAHTHSTATHSAEFSLPVAASASQPHTRNGRRRVNSDSGIETTGQRVSSKSVKLARRKTDAGMVRILCPSMPICCTFPSDPRDAGRVVRVCLLRPQKLGTRSRTRWLNDPKAAGSSDRPVSLAMKCRSVLLNRSGSPIASII